MVFEMIDYFRRRIAVLASLTFALFFGTAVAANAVVPSPEAIAGDIVDTAGTQLLATIVAVVPLLIPVLLGLWAISWVLRKLRLNRAANV